MLLALPALLGAGLIVVVLARPRWVSRHPGAVKGAIGVAGGNVPGLGWTRGYGHLVWTKAPFLSCDEAKYGQVVAVLRYLMLGFAAFGAAAVPAHPDWPRLLEASLVPALSLRPGEVTGALALLGTTLTSYVYMWEIIGRGGGEEEPPDRTAGGGGLARARAGAVAGAVFTAVILWFMLVAAAATLGRHHQAVASAQDAGALRPLAGGPVRRGAHHLGSGRPARPAGDHRLRGRRTL